MRLANVALALFVLVPIAPTVAQTDRTDHPLVSSYEGSAISRKDVKEFDEYSAFLGMDEAGEEPKTLALEGKVTKIVYRGIKDRSILEIFRNYEMAIQQSGADILYSCNQAKYECAERYAGVVIQKASDIRSIRNQAGRYLLAKLDQDAQTAYIAVAVGDASTTIHVVEVKGMQTGMVALDAAALGQGLDAKGYAVVDGIHFDTDKATLQARSGTALAEMGKLLTDRQDLSVYIVGHTDSVGSFAHNLTLSENRAKSVIAALANDHGIDMNRMQGHGVGPLAPEASNASDGGRAKNRRVVLVAK